MDSHLKSMKVNVSDPIALAVLLLSVSVLVGWQTDIESLKRVVPGFATMNPLTAVCLAVSACALWLVGSPDRHYRHASLLLSLVVFAAASWNLAADAGGFGVGPDQFLFATAVNAEVPVSRMAPSTTIGFLLVAISLARIQSEREHRRATAQWFAFALASIALFATVGYIYGAGTVRTLKPFSLMALHTSLGLLLLSIGLLFKDTDTGPMALVTSLGAAGRLLRRMIPAVILVPILLGWICILGEERGLFGTRLALTMLATWSMILLFLLTFVTAATIQAKDKERLRRLEVLRASETRISSILSIAADAIISIDANQRITLFNAWAEKLFGYTRSEVLGRRLEILLPERSRATHAAHIDKFGAGHVNARRMGERQEIYARKKDGSEFPAEASISKLELEGQPIYTVVLRDMTESHRAAEALVRAKEVAESAARSKSDFLANMSHEIRTPLNSISGFTQLLLERKDLNGDVRAQLKKIRNASVALTTTVNDILDYSKLEEGKITLSLVPFSPVQLLDNCVSIMGNAAEQRNLQLKVSVSPELSGRFYLSDPHRLQQIVLNLLSNALKFTHEGGVTIALVEADAGMEQASLRFSVTDTGIGIPPESLGLLFQRFSQVDGSVSRSYGGTGLGLAICRRLVTLMGGEIGVESEPGKGSTFWFRLPMQRAASPDQPPEAVSGRRRNGARRSILLVEDVELNREIAAAMLESAGHRVEMATNGAEAVEMVAAKRYDLVLMDIQMPTMDGITATEAIRAMESDNNAVPVIAMTANVLPDEVARFLAAGMNGHLRKPIDLNELIAAVDRWAAGDTRAVA